MIDKFKRLNSVVLGIIGLVIIVILILGFVNKNEKEDFPKTFEGAVNQIVESLNNTDKSYIKSIPRFELIIFHHGWGTGIRNSLGLWGKNNELLESCAKKTGTKSIHPDDASMLLIEGVWEKLNNDIEIVNFDTIPVNDYFNVIHKVLIKAKDNKEYLKILPSWIFEVRRLSDFNSANKNRGNDLMYIAKDIVNNDSEHSYLGMLYLTYYYEDIDSLNFILNSKFKIDNKDLDIPSFYSNDMNPENLIFLQSNQKKIANKTVEYYWNTIPIQYFVVSCFGSIINKRFNSLDSFLIWQKQKESNYLVKWQNKSVISKNDFDSLLIEPIRLLKILTLTNKYFYFDEHNDGLTTGCFANSKNSIQNFILACGHENRTFKSYPYDSTLQINTDYIDNEYQQFSLKATNSLSFIADKLTDKELFDLLDSISIIEYNNTLKTDDLAEYKYFAGFLFATQYKRILSNPDKNKVFEICYYYWRKEFITWKMQDYLTDLLFRINSQRSKQIFAEYFAKEPTEGSFDRNGILSSMIKYDFSANKEFIFNWYWKVQDKEFRTHPKENELILSLLKDTNDQTKELYDLILSDKRYKK